MGLQQRRPWPRDTTRCPCRHQRHQNLPSCSMSKYQRQSLHRATRRRQSCWRYAATPRGHVNQASLTAGAHNQALMSRHQCAGHMLGRELLVEFSAEPHQHRQTSAAVERALRPLCLRGFSVEQARAQLRLSSKAANSFANERSVKGLRNITREHTASLVAKKAVVFRVNDGKTT